MKGTLKFIAVIFGLAIGLYILWLNLPVTINRHSDIKFANRIIDRIDSYSRDNALPDSYDWATLKKFGFKDEGDFLTPEYQKLNEKNYQLTFVEGFDGPYLTWNSLERKWKKDHPLFPDEWKKK